MKLRYKSPSWKRALRHRSQHARRLLSHPLPRVIACTNHVAQHEFRLHTKYKSLCKY